MFKALLRTFLEHASNGQSCLTYSAVAGDSFQLSSFQVLPTFCCSMEAA